MKTGPPAFGALRPAWSMVRGHIREAISWGAVISWRSAWYLPASPEWKRYIAKLERFRQAIEAYEAGQEVRFWSLVEDEVGRRPDPLLRGVLERHYLPRGEEAEPWEYFWLVDHHRRRLKASNLDKWYRQLREQIYHDLNKNPRRRLMRALKGYPKSPPEKRLWSELPGALMHAEAEGFFAAFGDLLGEVERRIVEDNRLLRHTRKPLLDEHGEVTGDKIISSNAQREDGEEFDLFDAFEKTLNVEEFERTEKERRERRRDELSKRFSPTELRIARFLRHEYNKEKHGPARELAASRELGISYPAVRVHVFNMKAKARGA